MTQEWIIPDLVAFILFGWILGSFLGIILAFSFRSSGLIFVGMISGVISGVAAHWYSKQNWHFQAPTQATHMPSDIEHLVKIFDSWAGHSNFVAACFVGVVGIVVWGMIKVTELHVKNPHTVHYAPPTLPPYQAPLQLDKPKEEHRGNLPAKT